MNRPASRALPLVLLAILLSLCSTALADRAVIVVDGSKGKELSAVTAVTREALEGGGWTVVEPKLSSKRIAQAFECAFGEDPNPCVGAFLDEVGADRVVALRLTSEKRGGSATRVVSGQILRRGGILAVQQRHCTKDCEDAVLTDHVRALVVLLLRDAKAKLAPATLIVRSEPTGARVTIDGTPVGATELTYGIYAGMHTVLVELDGYRPETREVTIGDGEQQELEIPLRRTGSDERHDGDVIQPPPRPPRSRGDARRRPLAPWLVVGGGVAIAAGGIVLVAVDDDGLHDDTFVPMQRDTAPAGVALIATGIATVSAGFVWRYVSGRHGPPTVAPAVSVDRDHAHLGIFGRF